MAPRNVSTSVWLHAVSYFLGFAEVVITKGAPDSAGKLVAWLLVLAIFSAYLRGIYAGRNWLRWLSVALTTYGIVAMPWQLPSIPSLTGKAVYLLQCVLIAGAAALLFAPASRGWFRPNKSSKADALTRAA